MASVTEINDEQFETEILKSEQPVLVDFWADWCVPCHMVSPVVEEIGNDKADVMKVAKMNVEESPATSRKYAVMSIPTLILFVNGEERTRLIGAKPKDVILREIERHLSA